MSTFIIGAICGMAASLAGALVAFVFTLPNTRNYNKNDQDKKMQSVVRATAALLLLSLFATGIAASATAPDSDEDAGDGGGKKKSISNSNVLLIGSLCSFLATAAADLAAFYATKTDGDGAKEK